MLLFAYGLQIELMVSKTIKAKIMRKPKTNMMLNEIEMLSDTVLFEIRVMMIEVIRSINMPIDNLILWFIAFANIRNSSP